MLKRPGIIVLAGVNGAGKSSVGGRYLQSFGMDWYNPDAMAHRYRISAMPQATAEQANAYAWKYGFSRLQTAIEKKLNYAFEATLGGNSITALLKSATPTHELHILYCGLESIELHIERVKKRVLQGGHDIAESAIRRRWTTSRQHLVDLMPYVTSLRVFDNTKDMDPAAPLRLNRIIKVENGKLLVPGKADYRALTKIPHWARAIVAKANSL